MITYCPKNDMTMKTIDELMLMVDEKEKMAIVSYDNGWSCKNELEWRWAEIDRVRRGWGIGSLCSDGSIILTWGSGRSAQWAARTIVPISGAGYCRHEVRFPAVNASEHKVLWCVNDIFCNCGFGFCFGFVFLFFDLPELGLKNGYIKLMQNVSSSNQKQRLKQSEPCQERDRGERERASERAKIRRDIATKIG